MSSMSLRLVSCARLITTWQKAKEKVDKVWYLAQTLDEPGASKLVPEMKRFSKCFSTWQLQSSCLRLDVPLLPVRHIARQGGEGYEHVLPGEALKCGVKGSQLLLLVCTFFAPGGSSDMDMHFSLVFRASVSSPTTQWSYPANPVLFQLTWLDRCDAIVSLLPSTSLGNYI